MKDLADMRRQLHDLEAQPQIDTGPDPLSMPTMSGHEGMAELRRLQPDIKVVIVTGYATAEVNVEGAAAILQKPFNVAAHLDRIDQVLSS